MNELSPLQRFLPHVLVVIVATVVAACAYPRFGEHRGEVPAPVGVERRLAVPQPADPELTQLGHVPLLRLRGTGYERGWQYGHALGERWRYAVRRMEQVAEKLITDEIAELDAVASGLVTAATAHVVQQFARGDEVMLRERMTPDQRGYIRGLADGAGLEIGSVLRMVAFVMLSDASCSAFVAYGPATDDGRLLQLRSLDWGGEDLPAQEQTVLLVHEPKGGLRYLSPNVVGVVGALSGVNEAGISISEIGAGSHDTTWRGMPMPLLLSKVLAEARTLDEAITIFREAPGTGGYNFMVGSARERRGAAIEKTAHHTAVFEISPDNYRDNPYFHGYAGFDCRADTAADPAVRGVQDASNGPHGSPAESGSYRKRYRRQIELFESFGRVIDIGKAHRIAAEVAAGNNLHSILYDFERGRVYLRNQAWFRDGRIPDTEEDELRAAAGRQPPLVIPLDVVFPPRR